VTLPGALTTCSATGLPHEIVDFRGELVCQDCRRPLETCCEGDAGREVYINPDPAARAAGRVIRKTETIPELHAENITPRPQRSTTPAHLIGRVILDRIVRPEL
jgi:hypothetical protein